MRRFYPSHPDPANRFNPTGQNGSGPGIGIAFDAPAEIERPIQFEQSPPPLLSYGASSSGDQKPPITISMQDLVHQYVASVFQTAASPAPGLAEAHRRPHLDARAGRSPPAPLPTSRTAAAGAGVPQDWEATSYCPSGFMRRGPHAAATSPKQYSSYEQRLDTDPFSALHLTTSNDASTFSAACLPLAARVFCTSALINCGPRREPAFFPPVPSYSSSVPRSGDSRMPSSLEADTDQSTDTEAGAMGPAAGGASHEPSDGYRYADGDGDVDGDIQIFELEPPTEDTYRNARTSTASVSAATAEAEDMAEVEEGSASAGNEDSGCRDSIAPSAECEYESQTADGARGASEAASASASAWDRRGARRKRRPRPGTGTSESADEKLLCQICGDTSLGCAPFQNVVSSAPN